MILGISPGSLKWDAAAEAGSCMSVQILKITLVILGVVGLAGQWDRLDEFRAMYSYFLDRHP